MEIVFDAKAKTLQDVIRGKVALEAVIHTDGLLGYNGLVDVGYDKHFRLNKSKHSPKMADILTGLRASGVLQKDVWRSSMASRKTSNFTSKNTNGDGIRIMIL